MIRGRLDDDFVCSLRSASTTARDLYGDGVGSSGRWRSSEVQRGRSAGRFRGDTSGQRSGCNRPFVGGAAAAPLDYRRICCTDGAIGQ